VDVTRQSPPSPDQEQAAVEVEDLSKQFGTTVAVDRVTFTVGHAEVFAFLGPNGAGKSTTISILCTLTSPSAGSARVAGFDVVANPQAVRRRIGLVFQEPTLDDQLTAEENLRFHAVLYRVPQEILEARIDEVLHLVSLGGRRRDLVSTFSGGMARRLEIARGMLHTPTVLFLDEPTLGLDPQTRALVWDDVLALRRDQGVSVFLTTHYMEEAEVADRIGIIDQGRIVALDSPDGLKASLAADTVELHTGDDRSAIETLRAMGYRAESSEGRLRVFTADGENQVGRMVEAIGGGVSYVHVHRPTLDDVFLHTTGREIREEGAPMPSARARAWRRRR
jgi:ABC-2 type transport system ATP-binding protein